MIIALNETTRQRFQITIIGWLIGISVRMTVIWWRMIWVKLAPCGLLTLCPHTLNVFTFICFVSISKWNSLIFQEFFEIKKHDFLIDTLMATYTVKSSSSNFNDSLHPLIDVHVIVRWSPYVKLEQIEQDEWFSFHSQIFIQFSNCIRASYCCLMHSWGVHSRKFCCCLIVCVKSVVFVGEFQGKWLEFCSRRFWYPPWVLQWRSILVRFVLTSCDVLSSLQDQVWDIRYRNELSK